MLFARVPVAGKVKTRLIPALGADGACRLYRAMLQRSLEALAQTTAAERQLWLAGDRHHQAVAIARPSDRLHVYWQQGADIGERMAQAFQHNFRAGMGPIVVAGSDCPQLTVGHYEQVLEALQRHDAVLIPALDGGYVLLGLSRWDASLFVDVPWGTSAVLRTTVARLESLGWSWCALPGLPDIDRAEDLVHLQGLGLDY
jgi:rSAM/selenodomain-associated transferase 1